MSRIRSVHPGFFTDENIVSVSVPARLLLIGLGIEADDKGTFQWKEKSIKMRLFPADNIDVVPLLAELASEGLLMAYEVGGKAYGAIRNFVKHQRPKYPNNIHPVTEEARAFVGFGIDASAIDGPHGDTIPEMERVDVLPFPTKAEKSPQMEDGGESKEETPKPPRGPLFDDFWKRWPNKVAKSPAEKAWKKMSAQDRSVVVDRCEGWFASWRKAHPDASPIYASTFLNQKRWQDMDDAPKDNPMSGVEYWAAQLNKPGAFIPASAVSPSMAAKMIEAGLVTIETLKARGIAA